MRYVKQGSVARWESGTLVRVVERGLAVEEEGSFSCSPEPGELLAPVDPTRVGETARRVLAGVPDPVELERLVITDGISVHHLASRSWSERHQRVHASLTGGGERAMIDLGSFELGPLFEAAAALLLPRVAAPPLPGRLRLAPAVAAATLSAAAGETIRGCEIRQTGGGIDGRGLPIEEVVIDTAPWPNWYRPSYRLRPVRLPLDLRFECASREVDPGLPRAVALLAPATPRRLRLLVVDGARTYVAEGRLASVDAVAPERAWFPYGGGAFGSETAVTLTPPA